MLFIAILFCFFDNKNIDILRTGVQEEEKNLLNESASPRTEEKFRDIEKKEQAYSFLDQIPMINEVKALLMNKMYMLITATITVIMFSACGL